MAQFINVQKKSSDVLVYCSLRGLPPMTWNKWI